MRKSYREVRNEAKRIADAEEWSLGDILKDTDVAAQAMKVIADADKDTFSPTILEAVRDAEEGTNPRYITDKDTIKKVYQFRKNVVAPHVLKDESEAYQELWRDMAELLDTYFLMVALDVTKGDNFSLEKLNTEKKHQAEERKKAAAKRAKKKEEAEAAKAADTEAE